MRTIGIIAECNPFHQGHAYLLREARRQTQADYIVVAMSGDFVQRGAPAIVDKRTRVRDLLAAGADLVLEIPLYAACGSAGYFAAGGVRLLESLGVVTDLWFGSESGDTGAVLETAARMDSPSFDEAVRDRLREGLSYPAAMAEAMGQGGRALPVGTPNDLLAAAYCLELNRTGSSIVPHALLRCETEGATAIRRRMLACPGDQVLLSEKDLSGMLLHALLYAPLPLSDYQDVSRELADRIHALLPRYEDYDSFCALLKNKSLTYTRIRRALLHILLDLRREDVDRFRAAGAVGYIRPLGFRRTAAPLLREISRNSTVPCLSRLAVDRKKLKPPFDAMLDQDLRASELCSLIRQIKGGEPAAVSELSRPLLIL